jgi:peptidoglycan hydrolase-like protein with peptidoglycan-binding domain
MAGVLRSGSTGPEVESLQNDLGKLGYVYGRTDGIFGAKMEAVVRQLQLENGLTVDGVVGDATRAAMSQQGVDEQLLKEGGSNDAVKVAQGILAEHGFDVGTVDGIFGPQLLAAVKMLQDKHGLTADGIIGPQTWRALKGL